MPDSASSECPCLAGDFYYEHFEERYLGLDADYGEVTVNRCKRCGRYWLRYLMEYEHLTAAGRWFEGLVTEEMAASITAQGARAALENLDWYYLGGSAFDGRIGKQSGSLDFWLL